MDRLAHLLLTSNRQRYQLAAPSVLWLFIDRAVMLALTGMLLTCIAYARAGSCRQFSMVADDVMTDHVTLQRSGRAGFLFCYDRVVPCIACDTDVKNVQIKIKNVTKIKKNHRHGPMASTTDA